MIRNNLCLSIVLPLDFGQSALLLFSESVVRTKGVGPSGEKKRRLRWYIWFSRPLDWQFLPSFHLTPSRSWFFLCFNFFSALISLLICTIHNFTFSLYRPLLWSLALEGRIQGRPLAVYPCQHPLCHKIIHALWKNSPINIYVTDFIWSRNMAVGKHTQRNTYLFFWAQVSQTHYVSACCCL